MKAAWMKVGLAQRDVPAHVIHEYCRLDQSFANPTFKEDKLPRVTSYWNNITGKSAPLLPFVITQSSGLGVNFALLRGRAVQSRGFELPERKSEGLGVVDLAAVTRFDEVRTEELKQSLDNLRPKALEHKLGR